MCLGAACAAAILAGVLVLHVPAWADEVELNSGTIYKGKVLSQNADEVTIEVVKGAGKEKVTLAKITVKEIRMGGEVPAPADPAPKAGTTATPEEVEKAIAAAGTTHPAWWDSAKADQPKDLDLTWGKGAGDRSALEDYLDKNVRPRPAMWKSGVRTLDEALAANKSDAAKSPRSARPWPMRICK